MKKIVAVAVMMLVISGAYAQDAISKFFSKYQNDESFSQVNISSRMFGLFTQMEADNPEDKEVLDAISKLKGLKIIAKDDTRNARELYKEAFAVIPKDYEELMTVRDKDKDMKFMIKESGGKISELLMVMGGNEQFMVMSLFGEIDLKQVSRIGKKMDIKGLEHLQKMDRHDNNKDSKDNKQENSKDNKKN
jgi:CII-binding regulator of phage lambda lysogenization HflD